MSVLDKFSLKGKTAIVTGGEGLMGTMICETIKELGGKVYSFDKKTGIDLTSYQDILVMRKTTIRDTINIIVNNAVGNQKPVDALARYWNEDIEIGLTSALKIIQTFSEDLLNNNGVVLNIGSDLSLIAPDQSLYPEGMVKPLSYSVVKHGIIGLTRYYASLWGSKARCNCLCPGGIDVGQKFPKIPMGRLARLDEMQGPIAFLLSDASSYMTGAVLTVDGGRTII
jgi:NAD(P)-dependent dehydrogenase (short-subunit alcohol dehydrogenase family)